MELEAERVVRVTAGVLREGDAAGRRARAVGRAPVAFRLSGPRREHSGVNCYWLFLEINYSVSSYM